MSFSELKVGKIQEKLLALEIAMDFVLQKDKNTFLCIVSERKK